VSIKILRKLSVHTLILPFFFLASLFVVSSLLVVAQSQREVPQLRLEANKEGSGGVVTLSSKSDPVIELSSWNMSGTADMVLYKADRNFLLNYLRHNNEGKQIVPTVDTSTLQEVARFSENINNSGTRVSLPLDPSGVWYLKIQSGNASNDAVIVRSSFGGVVKSMGDAYVVWSQDFNTWRSLSQVSVKTYDLTENATEIANGVTGENGAVQLPFSTKADIALLEKDGQIALLPVNLKYFNTGYSYVRFSEIGDEFKYYLFTDRPLYKPGDTVYYKGIVRQDDDARYSVPMGTARVLFYRGWDQKDVVFEKLLAISADGSISGEYKMPENMGTGDYTMAIQVVADADAGGGWREDGRVTLQVEEYRKPEYFLELEAQQEAYVGEPMAVTVRGSYFSGQPLTSGQVKYTITSRDAYQPSTQADTKWLIDDDYRYGYWWSDTVTEGTVNLDTTGTAQIELPVSIADSTGKLRVFAVETEYMDQTGNPVQARKNILVHPGRWAIYRSDEGWYAGVVNKEYSIPMIVMPLNTETQVSDIALTAMIKRESWVKKGTGSATTYEREEENLPERTIVTDRKGTAKLSFTPNKEGYYTITVTSVDKEGRKVSNEFGAWISNESGYWSYGSYSPGLTVNGDKEVYKPGDTGKLTIFSEVPNRDVFMVFQRARVDRFQVVRIDGNSKTVSIPITDADMPNTFARVYSFSDNDLDTSRVELEVSAEKKRISVNLTPDRTYYGPGDTVNLTVKTTDTQGQAVPAEVAVWTVDKALFELSTDTRKNIFEAFWTTRYESATEGHSLEHINFYAAERGGGCFVAGTQILMGDGSLQNIEKVKVGDTVTTRKSETDTTLVTAKVTGTHQTEEDGYLIINRNLKVTPNHILWVNNTWKMASEIQVDDSMVAENGETIVVDSVEWFAQKVQVYNLTVEGYHTYFANGYWVHNQKGDLRTVLKDAAYWNPTVRTDASGTAKVTFKLPDNLTTWVISGVASTTATAVGEAKTEIITQKEVVMRPVVPNILRVGDSLKLSSLLHNYTESDKKFTASLELPGAQVVDASQPGVVVAGKGGTEQLYWSVKPTTVDLQAKATFTAKAEEGDFGDAIAQPLPIIPFGFTENLSFAGMNATQFALNLPADTDDTYSKVTLNLSPTMLGTLPGAMQYLLEYPYGCVEQTTSRFVPAVIAKSNAGIFADAFKDKDVADYIDHGITRLALLQNTDGGWGWTSNSTSDPFITAYVIEYLMTAKKTGTKVPQEIFTKAQTFLSQPTADSATLILNSYALQKIGDIRGNVEVPIDQSLSPDVLSYAVMVNYTSGNKNPDTNGATALLGKVENEGELASLATGKSHWFGSRDASTALALRALTYAGVDRSATLPLARYLLEKRQKHYWSNTFGTAQVVQAIVDFTKAGGDLTPTYKYSVAVNGKTINTGAVDAATKTIKPIEIAIADAKSGAITVQKEGEGNLYSSVAVSAFRTSPTTKAAGNGITIKREYIAGKGAAYYPSVGDTVSIRLTLEGIPASTEYLVVEDYLPAGMIPINTNLKNESNPMSDYYYGGYWYGNEEKTKKDGAVFLLSDLSGSSKRTVTYEARVISSGEFQAPPALVADMYNSDVRGNTAAEVVKVTETVERDPKKIVSTFFDGIGSFPQWVQRHLRELIGSVLLLAGLGVTVFIHRRRLQKQKAAEIGYDPNTGYAVGTTPPPQQEQPPTHQPPTQEPPAVS
jgi:uncharacterized protein YfaS (alpha-2-macroglobulin family)